jgi:type IV secretion system protein VirB1
MSLGAALLACAVGVAPATMDAIVHVESGGVVTAVHINKWPGRQPRAGTVEEAVAIARSFIAAGYTVDLGLGQLNSRNLAALGYSIEDAFDPCKNLAAGGRVLSGFYAQAVEKYGEGQTALAHALSAYNTGNLWAGFSNGYVSRYYINVSLVVPAMTTVRVAATIVPVKTTVVYDRPGYEGVFR